jgi:RNA polymerase sigma factor (sigma-70 family)
VEPLILEDFPIMSRHQLDSVLRHIQKIVGAPGGEELMDRQLLKRFSADRDEAAFATLVRRHGPLVMGACRRLLPQTQDAEDVFQATFLVLARKAGSIRWRDSVGNWLYGVACRLAWKTKSAVARRQAQERETAAMAKAKTGSEVDCREVSSVLDEELQRLPGKYRTPLLLCFLEGRTRDQAARQLGLSLRTLDRRLQQGRDLLRRRLTRRGVTLSAGLLAAGLFQNAGEAAVPAALMQTTVQAALLIVSGKGAGAGTISASVAALTRSACLAMAVTRLKVAGVVLLAVGLLGTGVAGMLVRKVPGSAPTNPNLAAKPLAVALAGKGQAGDEPARAGPDADPLPPGAVARLGSTRMRPGHPVGSVAFSPDGKTLVSGRWGPGIHFWDIATGKELRRFAPQHHGLHVAYCPDGKTLASLNSSENIVRLWDLEAGAELRQFVGHERPISAFAFAPDGKTLASAGSDKTVRLWRVATGEQITKFDDSGDIQCLAYSRAGKFVAGGTESGGILLWECATGKLVHHLAGHQRDVSQLTWSPDDRILASGGSDGTIRLWDPGKGREIRRLGTGTPEQIERERKKVAALKADLSGVGYLGWVNGLVFSRDGKLLYSAGGDYRCLFVWDVTSGKELRRQEGPQRISCLARSADGKTLAAGGTAHQIDLWDLNTEKRIHPLNGPQGRIDAVAFSPDGKALATAGDDQDIRVWEAGSWREIQRLARGVLAAGESPIGALTFSRDGKFLAIAGPWHRVVVWDWAAKKQLHLFLDPQLGGNWPPSLAFSPDGKMLAGTFHGVTVWDMASGKELHRFDGSGPVVFSPDGRLLALEGAAATIYLCEPITGKVVRKFEKLQDSVTTPSGQKFSNLITGLAFSADGKSLLSGTFDAKLRLWETATGKQRLLLEGHKILIQSVAFSPNGKYLASGSGSIFDHNDNTVRLWDAVTSTELRRFTAHQNVVVSIAFSADGTVLASGSEDGTVLIWDVSRLDSAKKVDTKRPSASDLESLWADLAGEDAANAYQAMHIFISAATQTVTFLQKNLQPAVPIDARRMTQLIADLDSDRFPMRQKAAHELEDHGDQAESALRKGLQAKPSIEMRRQIEGLLEKLQQAPAGKQLRALRAVEVLEHLGTPEAREVLRMLAKGVPEARLTQEAKTSLERLERRTTVGP